MPQVTGIGGVFFKAKGDPKVLAAWYQEHLGIKLNPWGTAVFRWAEDKGAAKAATAWTIDEKNSEKYSSSESSFMINYRVDNLVELLAQLRASGIEPIQGPESHENGKFAWIRDPDGNKVELWEPKLWRDKA